MKTDQCAERKLDCEKFGQQHESWLDTCSLGRHTIFRPPLLLHDLLELCILPAIEIFVSFAEMNYSLSERKLFHSSHYPVHFLKQIMKTRF